MNDYIVYSLDDYKIVKDGYPVNSINLINHFTHFNAQTIEKLQTMVEPELRKLAQTFFEKTVTEKNNCLNYIAINAKTTLKFEFNISIPDTLVDLRANPRLYKKTFTNIEGGKTVYYASIGFEYCFF